MDETASGAAHDSAHRATRGHTVMLNEPALNGSTYVLERRVNTAISAVAAMVTSAWEAAGKPAVSADPPPRPIERRDA